MANLLDNYLPEYELYIRTELHLSENTVLNYYKDIKDYCIYLDSLKEISTPENITSSHVRDYLAYLKRKRISTTSLSRKLSSVKSFHSFLVKYRYTKQNVAKVITNPKKEKKLPVVLSLEEVDALLNVFTTDSPIDIRDKAMIELCYSCGLRVSELIELKISNIHMQMQILNVFGKGSKERIVPFGDKAKEILSLYFEKSRPILIKNKNTDYVFLSHSGDKMTRQNFFIMLNKKAKEANITKKISPHKLRHSFATHLLASGLDLRFIQELLGHEDISTTEIYTQINNQQVRKIYDKTHPHSKSKK